jgi:hypothetical protein
MSKLQRPRQRGQQQRRQDGDDRDDDQEFNEGESTVRTICRRLNTHND